MNQFLRLSTKMLSSVLFLEFSSEDDFLNFDRELCITTHRMPFIHAFDNYVACKSAAICVLLTGIIDF